MRVILSGHHVDVTPALRTYVERKLARVLRRFDRVIEVQCTLTVDKLRHRAEATVNLAGARLFADAIEENMYAAIDSMIDKLDRQVRKHKEKITDHHARDAGKRDIS